MAKGRKPKSISLNQMPIEQYSHLDKERLNNPPVGLVSNGTDIDYGQLKKKYEYDPHLDPQLQWTGKTERPSFEVPVVSLHVHERMDPKTILEAIKKEDNMPKQISLFEQHEKPLREAIEFYKHKENWSNRLIAGDSLLVMNSLLEKEGMSGKVQMVYIDPPYGIRYGSNFQPFVDKRDVKDGSDEDLTQEPEMIKAFRDTWDKGIHSYLSYMRDRVMLVRELLNDSGSIFIQISDENIHFIRNILDEIFGATNFMAIVPFRKKTMPLGAKYLERMYDYIVWYSKNINTTKYHPLYEEQNVEGDFHWSWYETEDGKRVKMSQSEINNHSLLPKGARIFRLVSMWPASFSAKAVFEVVYKNQKFHPPQGQCWPTNEEGMKNIINSGRVHIEGGHLRRIVYLDEYSHKKLVSMWADTAGARDQNYVVETSPKVIERCLLMTTDPGDLIFDITCGGGTTAYVSEKWGRRWITCDTSRVALTISKQRLMTSIYDYYCLARPSEGVGSGFKYKSIILNTLKNVANQEENRSITLFDKPLIDLSKKRVTGPFTVESIPAPMVKNLERDLDSVGEAEISVSRSGETLRQDQWRDELLRSGVRAKNGVCMDFTYVKATEGTKHIQAQAETKNDKPEKVLIVFGPEHAPLEQRTVELAIDEARYLKPDILLFCAFQFDDEAAKDIDETPERLIGFKLLKALINMDLQTDDLKKNRNSNQSFWLIGQPDVKVHEIEVGEDRGKIKVEVNGYDYYNPRTGSVDSGSKRNIAMWLLDPDYDGRSLFPRQVFLPMSGVGEGWSKLAKNLKSEIDEDKMVAYNGTISLPFKPGKIIAIKIIDDRGIESLKIIKR